ncbi:MAG: RHS repeat-associated core domain-containing protein [Verrucomicrobiota bacterium]
MVTATYAYDPVTGDATGIDYSDSTPDVVFSDFDRLGRPQTITQGGVVVEKQAWHAGKGTLKARYNASTHSLLAGLGVRYDAPDSAGRPAGFQETSGSDATVVRSIGYGYDSGGRLETLTDGSVNHVYAYHPNSSLVSTIHSRSGTTAWFRQSRLYDTQGRLTDIDSHRMNGTTVAAAISHHGYGYDDLGRRTTDTFQDGSRTYGYNDRSEVTSATRKTSGGTTVSALGSSYSYDGIGNRLTSTSPVLGDRTYTPNALNQYASITTAGSRTAVGRAPAGWTVQVNGTNATRTGDIYHHALTASNGSAPVWQSVVTKRDTGSPSFTGHLWYPVLVFGPQHDADGNLTDDGRWTYVWDAENRLIQMETTPAALMAGHPYTKEKNVYDWGGRLIARTIWKGGSVGSPIFKSNQRWLYDGWNPIAEFTATSETTTTVTRAQTHTWGLDLADTDGVPRQRAGGVGGLISVSLNSQPSTLNYSPSYDGNGNIVAWTKSDQLAPTSRREYDAFGNAVVSEGIAPCAFGFSTKLQDGETGLYYYGYRYYDPVNGRWLNRDPIGEKGGTNLYENVHNNLISNIDYLGLLNPDKLADITVKACTTYVIGGHGLNLPRYGNGLEEDPPLREETEKKLKDGKIVDQSLLDGSDLPNRVEATACGASAIIHGCSANYAVTGAGDVTLSRGEPVPDDYAEQFGKSVEKAKENASQKCGDCCAKIAIIVKAGREGSSRYAFLNEDGSRNEADFKNRYANWTYDCKSKTLTKNNY